MLACSATPRVPGIDDFVFRRGRRYGTLLVDEQAQRERETNEYRDELLQ